MSTFTPGPWIAKYHRETASYRVHTEVLGEPVVMGKHNASLMAAAPDLLEACFLAWVEIDQFHSTAYPKCEGGCPAHEAMDRIKAAVTKALERDATFDEAQSFMWDYQPPAVRR
jgi:hypothetical protein